MKIVLDRPVRGFTEIANDPTRERTSGVTGFAGWHGLVLFGEGKRPKRLPRLEFFGGHCLVGLSDLLTGSALTVEDALESAFEASNQAVQFLNEAKQPQPIDPEPAI